MKRDISDKAFEDLSKEKKKQYIAELLIRQSGAASLKEPVQPIAVIMAGLPGAGKTEFLDSLVEIIKKGSFEPFVRIDLDQIVTVFPLYTPQSYDKFRKHGNFALARCIDVARKGRYNVMVDGTFSGISGASLENVEKLLAAGYIVEMFYMHDDALTAWEYTQAREIETKRGISRDGFLEACRNIQKNVGLAVEKFRSDENFTFHVVVQKALRDKDYLIVTDANDVDAIIKKGYNIDKLGET